MLFHKEETGKSPVEPWVLSLFPVQLVTSAGVVLPPLCICILAVSSAQMLLVPPVSVCDCSQRDYSSEVVSLRLKSFGSL
jgi:hypothetical protein